MNFDMRSPCPACPFRTDRAPFLTVGRAREIADMLVRQQGTFQCHVTVDHDALADEDGDVDATLAAQQPEAQHCAGAAIMLEHMQRPNQWMRICERLRFYDRTKLDMTAPVFHTATSFVAAHRTGARRKSALAIVRTPTARRRATTIRKGP